VLGEADLERVVTRYARLAAARRPVSCHHPVLEVGDAGRLDGPDLLEVHLRVPEVIEETSTVAEHHRIDVELKLVQQSGRQVLLGDLGAAPKHDVTDGIESALEQAREAAGGKD
jgi:hypothetical protein